LAGLDVPGDQMKVVIEGSRSSREDWMKAQSADELPVLRPEQK
jgi:hypothetical protein